MTSEDLADRTATTERYVREWCLAQAGFGCISYDAASGRFSMSPEQQAVFADADSPTFLTGGYYAIAAMCIDEPKVTHIFKSGEGLGWGEHDNCLFCGAEKFSRPGYRASLVSEWLPALDGVVGKLQAGGKVADVGCGHGASTLVMAEAFPRSEFIGFDCHDASIECANQRAKEAGLKNVRFEVATAKHYPGTGYDLVAYFDCLHDMGDPVGAVAHTRKALRPDGTMLLVEPAASDKVEDNHNPVGRMYYAFSTMICTPASISQEVGLALGAQAGPKQLERVAWASWPARMRCQYGIFRPQQVSNRFGSKPRQQINRHRGIEHQFTHAPVFPSGAHPERTVQVVRNIADLEIDPDPFGKSAWQRALTPFAPVKPALRLP